MEPTGRAGASISGSFRWWLRMLSTVSVNAWSLPCASHPFARPRQYRSVSGLSASAASISHSAARFSHIRTAELGRPSISHPRFLDRGNGRPQVPLCRSALCRLCNIEHLQNGKDNNELGWRFLISQPVLNYCEKKKPPDLRYDRGLSYLPTGWDGGRGMPGWLALNMGSAEAFATRAGSQASGRTSRPSSQR